MKPDIFKTRLINLEKDINMSENFSEISQIFLNKKFPKHISKEDFNKILIENFEITEKKNAFLYVLKDIRTPETIKYAGLFIPEKNKTYAFINTPYQDMFMPNSLEEITQRYGNHYTQGFFYTPTKTFK
jgi:hypothetical protein